MEFRSIRYALAVAKERSFTNAAARLNVSQSAVSEQVKLLEGRIGFDLFRRNGRGIDVTERGRIFLAEAERVATDVLALQDVAQRLSGVGVDTISMGLGSGIASLILPRLLPQGGVPSNLRLDVRTAPTRVIFDQLNADALDIGVSAGVSADRVPAGIVAEPLTEIEMVLLLPANHPLCALSGPIDLAALAREPFIISELSVGYGQIIMNAFGALGLRPSICATVDNVDTIKVFVQLGVGIALVPEGCARAEHELGYLQVRTVSPRISVTLHSYRSRHGLSRRKETILSALLSSFQTPVAAK